MASIFIPTQGNPTPIERKEWTGAAWGTFLAGLVAFGFDPFWGVAVGLAGMATGYMVGKNSAEKLQEKELKEGKKEVKEPTFWNRELAKGYTVSALINMGAAVAANTLLVGTGLGTLAVIAAAVAGLAIMIYKGFQGKNEMREEYARAKEIVASEKSKVIAPLVEVETPKVIAPSVEKTRVAAPQITVVQQMQAPTIVEPQEKATTQWQEEIDARRAAMAQITRS